MKVVRSLIFGWSPVKIQDYITSELMKFGVPEQLARSITKILADAGYLQSDQKQAPLILEQEFRVQQKAVDKTAALRPVDTIVQDIENTCAERLSEGTIKRLLSRNHYLRLAAHYEE
ncbi:MAG: hypothetical protein EBY40_14300 [Marivivens sp.]|jgi:hypothetical protein|nr:hypothetical protein [Marivivens sp.]